jgi:IclR family transcriptional regulator, acetate operon repressor
VGTISKALTLLDTISLLDKDAGLSELATISGLDKATTRRFLVELSEFGFVEQDRETKRYRLGAAPVRLARIRETRLPLLQVAIPFVKELAVTCGETAHLSQNSGPALHSIYVEDGIHANRVIVQVGIGLPLHATASGLAFLAFCDDELQNKTLSGPLANYSARTPTDPDKLRTLIADTRQKGFSICDQWLEDGVVSTAAPILNPAGQPIGSLAVAGPSSRFHGQCVEDAGHEAARVAALISRQLFGVTDTPVTRR